MLRTQFRRLVGGVTAIAGIVVIAVFMNSTYAGGGQARPQFVASINGTNVPAGLFALYLADARSSLLGSGEKGEITKRAVGLALKSSTSYIVQIQFAKQLGIFVPAAAPFFGADMEALKGSTAGFGATGVSEEVVLQRFLQDLRTAIIAKAYPRSRVESALESQYATHPLQLSHLSQITFRKIRLLGTSADQIEIMSQLSGQLSQGADFAELASANDAGYETDAGFSSGEGIYSLTGQEKFVDPGLLSVALHAPGLGLFGPEQSNGATYLLDVSSRHVDYPTFAQAEALLYDDYTSQLYGTQLRSLTVNAIVHTDRALISSISLK